MLSHVVSDLHQVYLDEIIKPQLGKDSGEKTSSNSGGSSEGSDEDSAKRIRQATYDIRHRAGSREEKDLEAAYNEYMSHSGMTGPEKATVKEKLGLGLTKSSVKEESEGDKKFQIRVKDRESGKTYVRNANREKINQLRNNPNISSVEMTKYGKPASSEAKVGKHTASVKAGKGLDPVGREDSDIDNDGDHDKTDKYLLNRRKVRGAAINSRGEQKEEFSNWRSELQEVIDPLKDKKRDKKQDEKNGKIQETNVDNSSIIKINPDLKESIENIGGEVLDVVEIREEAFEGILDNIHDAEIFFIDNKLINETVSDLFEELTEEGYEVDYIAENILESINQSLQLLSEANVTYGHDTRSDRRSGLLNKIGRAVKKAAYGAGKVAGSAVKGAKHLGKLAKKGYESGSGSSSESSSSENRSSESGDKKPGLLHRIGSSLKSGLKRAVEKGARSLSRASRNVARKMSEDLEMEALDTWSPERTQGTGDVDSKIKARKKTVKASEIKKKPATTASHLSYLPPLESLSATRKEEKNSEGKEKGIDGKACWKGYKYAGTKNGKDKCIKAGYEFGGHELDEVLTKSTSASDVISDFVHSKNKRFSGDSKKQRINRALGAYYSKHPEKSEKKVDEAIVDLKTKADDSTRNLQQKTVSKQQNAQKERQGLQQKPLVNAQDKKLASMQKQQLAAKMKQVNAGIPLKDSYEIEEAIAGLRPASERTKNAITPAQRKKQEEDRKRKQELKDKAELALAGIKKTAKPGAVTKSETKPSAPEANRKLKTGKKVDTLAVKANKVIASSYEMEGDSIDELNRFEKEKGKDFKTGKPTVSGGSAKNDKAFQMISKMMGSGRAGVQPRGKKKEPGKKPPAAGEYGGPASPAQKVAKRRAAAQRSQDSMSSRFD